MTLKQYVPCSLLQEEMLRKHVEDIGRLRDDRDLSYKMWPSLREAFLNKTVKDKDKETVFLMFLPIAYEEAFREYTYGSEQNYLELLLKAQFGLTYAIERLNTEPDIPETGEAFQAHVTRAIRLALTELPNHQDTSSEQKMTLRERILKRIRTVRIHRYFRRALNPRNNNQ